MLCLITGAVALAEFIAESLHLMRIDLRENDIKTGGLMALTLSLKVSSTVTRLDLDKEAKKENVRVTHEALSASLRLKVSGYCLNLNL